ncbi:MAG: hypothetical protein PHF35_01355 [Candidatus Moranbacteria bacterium]|nr:hypothetical protein [Candidatus Moranbacteria bacterium]
MKVDFWALRNDACTRSRLKRKISKKVWGQNMSFLSPEDLILAKLDWFKKKPAHPAFGRY